jgi:DNA-binding XRE family transcriptional regulator
LFGQVLVRQVLVRPECRSAPRRHPAERRRRPRHLSDEAFDEENGAEQEEQNRGTDPFRQFGQSACQDGVTTTARAVRRRLPHALGVHYQTVGYLERGEYSPCLHLALRIAAYFEVPVEVVFANEPFPRLGSGHAG